MSNAVAMEVRCATEVLQDPGNPSSRSSSRTRVWRLSIDHGFDTDTNEIRLDFTAGGRDFSVRIAHDYESEYASGPTQVNLKRLGVVLRASRDGVVRVTASEIQPVTRVK